MGEVSSTKGLAILLLEVCVRVKVLPMHTPHKPSSLHS